MERDMQEQRCHNSELDAMLGKQIDLLDHGFIRLVDYMGDQASIVQAARVSYGRGTKSTSEDVSLIRYLMRHRHTTPFEMCEIKLHVKLPIFVARQWIRHRMANVNEYSARYSILDREFYLPDSNALGEQSILNKQGRGNSDVLSAEISGEIIDELNKNSERVYDVYDHLLNDDGTGKVVDENRPQLARELARMSLSLNYYTQWYWKIDLHNLLHFLALRLDNHAQYEIRVYANAIWDIVKTWMPDVAKAFDDYRLSAVTFSKQEMNALKMIVSTITKSGVSLSEILSDKKLQFADLSKREHNELILKLEKLI
jgi:thymidylate synthase (FAD)